MGMKMKRNDEEPRETVKYPEVYTDCDVDGDSGN